jgi:Na+:H+ antiporter, NhaA family
MLKSGVHATISGVLLAFVIPFHKEDDKNPSYHLQHALHYPVAFVILPLFTLANTAIIFPTDMMSGFTSNNSIGIITGLVIGKFLGIFLISLFAVKAGLATLSQDLNWKHIAGIAFLGGIGFTMSIFITNLAFSNMEVITQSKMSILLASVIASLSGLLVLKSAKNKIG